MRKVLEVHRSFSEFPELPHRYDDKYALSAQLSRCALAALLASLGFLGLSDPLCREVRGWAADGLLTVTLRFEMTTTCAFLRKERRSVKSPEETVTTTSSSLSPAKTRTVSRVVTKVKEYLWTLDTDYALSLHHGADRNAFAKVLTARTFSQVVRTTSSAAPFPESRTIPPLSADATFLFLALDDALRPRFSLDTSLPSCRTPRRNAPTAALLASLAAVAAWAAQVAQIWREFCAGVSAHCPPADQLFVPILPFFESKTAASPSMQQLPLEENLNNTSSTTHLLSDDDLERCFAHQSGCIQAQLDALAAHPHGFHQEVRFALLAAHIAHIAQRHASAVDAIEQQLLRQLAAALGKHVAAADFHEYMAFHHRKLFRPAFSPLPFVRAIRRPDHSPEGVLSLFSTLPPSAYSDHNPSSSSSPSDTPITTFVREFRASSGSEFLMPINASTSVPLRGPVFLHAWLSQAFDGVAQRLTLSARAKQFSCFALVVGKVQSAAHFEPIGGIVLQNKQMLELALELEEIPTAKEFKRATASMSQQMQAFAKSFRAMQLSDVFAFAVLQIKPQLERLLRLPQDALTKHIRLTQDLLELFVKYQIPSDLLTYDGPELADTPAKVAAVERHVAAALQMIHERREDALDQRILDTRARLAALRAPPPAPLLSDMVHGLSLRLESRNRQRYASNSCSSSDGGDESEGDDCDDDDYDGDEGGCERMAEYEEEEERDCARAADEDFDEIAMIENESAADVPEPDANMPAPDDHQSPPEDAAQQKSAPEEPAAVVVAEDGPQHADLVDWTQIPGRFEARFEALDEDDAVRPLIIKPSSYWTLSGPSSTDLLSAHRTQTLAGDEQRVYTNQAFDLLDALSCSGELPFENSEVHVIIGCSHNFSKSLVETLIKDNVNPIEKVERSALVMATETFETPAAQMIKPNRLEAVKNISPMFF